MWVTFVNHGIVAERDVGNRGVKVIVGEIGLLKARVADIGVGVEGLGDSGGNRVKLDHRPAGVCAQIRGHSADEISDSGGGFQDAPTLETQMFQSVIHGGYNLLTSVMGVQDGRFRGFPFLIRQKIPQLTAQRRPFRLVLVKDVFEPAPADKLR